MHKSLVLRTDFCDELIMHQHHDETLSYVVEKINGCSISEVIIKDKNNVLEKELGNYITIEFENLHDFHDRENIIQCTSSKINELMHQIKKEIKKILVVGLGNKEVVSDALGPMCIDEILVTSHFYANEQKEFLKGTRNTAAFAPGVMGQTGMESAAMIESISKMFQPDLIFVIDALATSSLKRINQAIQINNAGIKPGSGVGNHRREISEKVLQVPVIAIGVATVTSIGTLLKDAMKQLELNEQVLHDMSEVMNLNLIVTPKSMDHDLKYLVSIISESINQVIHPDYKNL